MPETVAACDEEELVDAGTITFPMPPGRYQLPVGVVVWVLRRAPDAEWLAIAPVSIVELLEVDHETRHELMVWGAPDHVDWTVVETDGLALLVRPEDVRCASDSTAPANPNMAARHATGVG